MRQLMMVIAATAVTLSLVVGAGSATGETPPPPPINYGPSIPGDAGVSTATSPVSPVVGDFALLSSLVTNHGPGARTIDFVDTVPNGLSINAATAGTGVCFTLGQTVRCGVLLSAGESAPVNIVVTPTAAGTYTNKVSVTIPESETNPSDNSAAATLTVADAAAPPPAGTCKVPSLKRSPAAIAKRVLALLQCKPGKAKRAHSRRVAKGQVIRTTPKPGTYKQGKVVVLTVSSGPAKAKRGGR